MPLENQVTALQFHIIIHDRYGNDGIDTFGANTSRKLFYTAFKKSIRSLIRLVCTISKIAKYLGRVDHRRKRWLVNR